MHSPRVWTLNFINHKMMQKKRMPTISFFLSKMTKKNQSKFSLLQATKLTAKKMLFCLFGLMTCSMVACFVIFSDTLPLPFWWEKSLKSLYSKFLPSYSNVFVGIRLALKTTLATIACWALCCFIKQSAAMYSHCAQWRRCPLCSAHWFSIITKWNCWAIDWRNAATRHPFSAVKSLTNTRVWRTSSKCTPTSSGKKHNRFVSFGSWV